MASEDDEFMKEPREFDFEGFFVVSLLIVGEFVLRSLRLVREFVYEAVFFKYERTKIKLSNGCHFLRPTRAAMKFMTSFTSMGVFPRVSKDSQGTVDGSEIPFPTTVWMY